MTPFLSVYWDETGTIHTSTPVQMVERFAPKANNYKVSPEKPEINILIATERISAGVNMQDAVALVRQLCGVGFARTLRGPGEPKRLDQTHDDNRRL
jgi:hypothetical protein